MIKIAVNQKITRCLVMLFILISPPGIYGTFAQKDKPGVVKETVLLNNDRDLYFSGESLFFSAEYRVNGYTDSSPLSRVLYAELIDVQAKKPVLQKKFRIAGNRVNGVMEIPDDCQTGNYLLTAYTRYQRNFPEEQFATRLLVIFNPGKPAKITHNDLSGTGVMTAVAGGTVVPGDTNTLVMWFPEYLKKENIQVFIADSHKKLIRRLSPSSSEVDGIGVYLPEDENLQLGVIKENRDTVFSEFPIPAGSHIQSAAGMEWGNLFYRVKFNGNSDQSPESYTLTLVNSNFSPMESRTIDISVQEKRVEFEKEKCDPGICFFVLSDHNGNLVKVTSLFIPPENRVNIAIETGKNTYLPGEEVRVSLFPEDINESVQKNISVSVIRHGTLKEHHGFNPRLYFSHPRFLQEYIMASPGLDKTVIKRLLILFDQHAGHDFFSRLLKQNQEVMLRYLPESRGITLHGVLMEKGNQQPVKGKKIYASALDDQPQLHVATTGETGEFIFALPGLHGTHNLYLCPDNHELSEREFEIQVYDPFYGNIRDMENLPLFADTLDMALINESGLNAEVTKKWHSWKLSEPVGGKPTGFNIGGNNTIIRTSDYITLKSMHELFTEIVPNVKARMVRSKYVLTIYDENGNEFSTDPLILVDYVPVFDPGAVMAIDPAQVEIVEIIDKVYVLGDYTFNGVIMIFTKSKNYSAISLPPSGTFLEFPGLEKAKFPDELPGADKPLSSGKPDFRTTLYWNPALRTDNADAGFRFRTSHNTGLYDIVVTESGPSGVISKSVKQIRVEMDK